MPNNSMELLPRDIRLELMLRDPKVIDHITVVGALVFDFTQFLQWQQEEIDRITRAAIMHDIGKKSVAHWDKPGRLTPAEYEVVKTHPTIGVTDALLRHESDLVVLQVIQFHHERWDGRGYPRGLKEETIPLEARIVGICDSWEAMTVGRSYSQVKPHEVALQEIERCAGSQFDPVLAERFVQCMSQTQ